MQVFRRGDESEKTIMIIGISYLLSLLFWNKNMFRLVQFVNTLTTSYWYVSGAHYKIQDVSIFSPRSIYQAFQGVLLTHSLLLHPVCLFLVIAVVITKHTKLLTLQQDLICHSFNENWKKPLKSSIKAKRCSKNWKNLNALQKKVGLYQLLNAWSWRGWY